MYKYQLTHAMSQVLVSKSSVRMEKGRGRPWEGKEPMLFNQKKCGCDGLDPSKGRQAGEGQCQGQGTDPGDSSGRKPLTRAGVGFLFCFVVGLFVLTSEERGNSCTALEMEKGMGMDSIGLPQQTPAIICFILSTS